MAFILLNVTTNLPEETRADCSRQSSFQSRFPGEHEVVFIPLHLLPLPAERKHRPDGAEHLFGHSARFSVRFQFIRRCCSLYFPYQTQRDDHHLPWSRI